MAGLLDYSAGYPGGAAVKAAGYEGVIRYLRKEGESRVKPITVAELASMVEHGRTVAFVYQHVDKSRPLAGLSAGQHDAAWALARTRELGVGDPFIYFAVDFDAVPADTAGYFTGTRAVLGLNRSGAYGSDKVLKFLFDRNLISKGWQTAAWSGGRREPRAHLYQRVGQVTVGGVSCDVNDILKPDYGQYPSIQEDNDMTPEQAEWLRQIYQSQSQPSAQRNVDVGDVLVKLYDMTQDFAQVKADVAELKARPVADVDETALAAELKNLGVTGVSAADVKLAVQQAFARGAGVGGGEV